MLNNKNVIIHNFKGALMTIIQLSQTIKKRKEELGLIISSLFLGCNINTQTINRTFTDEDVCYSSISSVLKNLDLTLSISDNNV